MSYTPPLLGSGLGAPPPAATPSHWGIITAGDVAAEQARTLASAQQTDVNVQKCAGIDAATKAEWATFYAALTVWCRTPMINVWTPWAPPNAVVVSGDTGNTMMAWEAQLEGWQQKLDGPCPTVAPGLAPFNPQDPNASASQILRYGAIIAAFVGTAYVVGKVVDFIPKPSKKEKSEP